MEKKFDDNDEIQIDLLELAYALKKKLWLIILGLIVGAFGAGLYSMTKSLTLISLFQSPLVKVLFNSIKFVFVSRLDNVIL